MKTYDIKFGPSDPINPKFGYFIEVLIDGARVLDTSKHPSTGKDLDYFGCLEIAAYYGPKK